MDTKQRGQNNKKKNNAVLFPSTGKLKSSSYRPTPSVL